MSKSKNTINLKILKNKSTKSNPEPKNESKKVEELSPNLNAKQNDEQNDKITSLQEEIESLKTQLETAQNNSQDWQNKAMRYVADIDNARKQMELESTQIKKNTKKYTTKPLLEFLNNQFLAITFIKDTQDPKAQKALSTIATSFEKLISEFKLQNIEIILPQIGDEFDASFMQSLAPASDENHTIKHIVSLGLKIDTQLIQPAMVML